MPEFVVFEDRVYLGYPERVPATVLEYRSHRPERPEWQLQAFFNHYHFSNRNGTETCLRNQFADAEELESRLRESFPERRFVIQIEPECDTTFYEPDPGLEVKDGPWSPSAPLVGWALSQAAGDPVRLAEIAETCRKRTCNGCKHQWRFEIDYLRDDFPGTKWTDCPECGQPVLVAFRLLRRLITRRKVV